MQPIFRSMDEKNNIVIPIKGLSAGEHSFEYEIDGQFFQSFGNDRVKEADCTVKVAVIKRQTLLEVNCSVGGFVITECDRCLDDLTLKVDVERELTVGFGSVDMDDASDEEDVVVVDQGVAELNLNQFVYDYICLSFPIVKVHPKGKCNPEMMKYLSTQNAPADEEKSSPFQNLKDLLNSKNN